MHTTSKTSSICSTISTPGNVVFSRVFKFAFYLILQYFVFTKFFKRIFFYNIPANVEVDAKGDIKVDEFQNTSNEIVHAVGDVTGVWQLTPVAIGAGRKLAHR